MHGKTRIKTGSAFPRWSCSLLVKGMKLDVELATLVLDRFAKVTCIKLSVV